MKTPLADRAYELLREVPAGRVTTYKELAHGLGTKAYRAVGQAMRKNPYSFQACPEERSDERVPCHRVVASDGSIGGFMGKRDGSEISRKQELLQSEGVTISGNKILNFSSLLYRFDTHGS